MYNIHSHYENILAYANSIVTQPTVIYLHPFGSTLQENIEALQNSGFGPLIIAYDQEPINYFYNETLFKHIDSNYKNDQGKSRPTILLTTEKYGTEKNRVLKQFGYHDANYFFHALAASDWYRGYRYNCDITSVRSRKLEKKYISFNRITGNARVYRSFFIAELIKNNLINDGYVSYSGICPVHGHYQHNITESVQRYGIDPQYAANVITILDSVDSELRIDSHQCVIPNGSQNIGPIDKLITSFLHVVTETCFWDHRAHLTEKIFKPIVAKQPFVLLGCAYNLEYLKSYGFKTFDSWWDESYDKITDPITRLDCVVNIVKEICSMSLIELEQMLYGMRHVLDHNYELFYSQKFVDTVLDELKDNLKYQIKQVIK